MNGANTPQTITWVATGAPVEFQVGSIPKTVDIRNLATGAHAHWSEGMAAASAFIAGAAMSAVNGVTPISADDMNHVNAAKPQGFSLGALAGFNAAGQIGNTLQIVVT
jgi:fermentation-respiration switch protein FrsA (DUF1100 family)